MLTAKSLMKSCVIILLSTLLLVFFILIIGSTISIILITLIISVDITASILLLISVSILGSIPIRINIFSNRLEFFFWRESEPRTTIYLSEIDFFGINGRMVIDNRGHVLNLTYLTEDQFNKLRTAVFCGRATDSIQTGFIVSKGTMKQTPHLNVTFTQRTTGKIAGKVLMMLLFAPLIPLELLQFLESKDPLLILIGILTSTLFIHSAWSLHDLSKDRKLTINSLGITLTKSGKEMFRLSWRELKRILFGSTIVLNGHHGDATINRFNLDEAGRQVAFSAINTYATYYNIPIEKGYGTP